ncbi:MAG TPA: hypothetical protein ENK57_02400 [Polyangiaceae bacterium]|nr:hypothetical protein [Polyangiaceae bacterium]
MRRCLAIPLLLLTWLLAGCAGHESRVKAALDALDAGRPDEAIAHLNEEMGVETAEQIPKLEGDNALLLLDRATILQSVDRYELSQRDFQTADKAIEILDFKRGTADDIGKYLFSDDVGPYRAPPFEKLLINTFNMMNYLARHDVSGAKVEARRLSVMERYLKESGETTALLGLGSYLAGFTFEKAGGRDEALLYYGEALGYQSYPSLRDPLRVLTGGRSESPKIDEVVAGAGPVDSVASSGDSELLIVVGYGRVPQKYPERIPIGLALTMVSGIISPGDAAQANELAAKGLVTWVNFPRLGKSRGRHSIPEVWVDGRPQNVEHALDIEAEVRKEWEEREPTVVLSAITRMITRVLAGEAVDAAVGAASDSGIVGLLAGLATSATLTAADTPDTRSWSTLPSNVAICRLRLRPGQHTVQLRVRGVMKEYRVTTRPGDWQAVVMTALR